MDNAKDVDGHILVISKKHVVNILDCDNQTLSDVMKTVKKVANHLTDNCCYDGLDFLSANDESAGQSLLHFHVHIIPRRRNDGLGGKGEWPCFTGAKYEISKIFKKIKMSILICMGRIIFAIYFMRDKWYNVLAKLKVTARQIGIRGGKTMRYFNNKCDTIIKKTMYKGVEVEFVKRPAVIWVGCVDYAIDNESESDFMATLKRFQSLVDVSAPQYIINPDWSAAISINYKRNDRKSGMFFGNEVTSNERNERYDCFVQPEGMWLRIRNDIQSAALLGKEKADSYEYFSTGLLCKIAQENGYTQDIENNIEIEYNCHAEYNSPEFTGYAYIPVIEMK